MRKYIVSALLLFLSCAAWAEAVPEQLSPFMVTIASATLQVYIVGGATTSAATCAVFADSVAFTTVDGLYPGTTQFVFADTNKITVRQFVDYCTSVSTALPGAEGGIVVSIVNGSLDKNISAELTPVAAMNVFGVANKKTIGIDRQLGMSYTLLASGLMWGQQYHITGLNANAAYTVAGSTTNIRIYDGAKSTDTEILRYRMNATLTETPVLSIAPNGELAGSAPQKAMRFDIECSSWVVSGYMCGMGYRK